MSKKSKPEEEDTGQKVPKTLPEVDQEVDPGLAEVQRMYLEKHPDRPHGGYAFPINPNPVMTRRGSKYVDKLADLTAEQRSARLEEWKKSRMRRRQEERESQMIGDPSYLVEERDITEDSKEVQKTAAKRRKKGGKGKGRDVMKLSGGTIRKFLTEDKWGGLCAKVKEYQDELADITTELEEQGKPCTGCALKPYYAQFIKKLVEDFKDEDIISAEEVSAIKKELNIGSLQVGLRNGKVHVR